ncbi:MAG: hypothetical protein COS40_06200, partial [Deltaproteobacteria bacterium CG03_land_8_20_14_0_80_45_14]
VIGSIGLLSYEPRIKGVTSDFILKSRISTPLTGRQVRCRLLKACQFPLSFVSYFYKRVLLVIILRESGGLL